MAIPRRCLIDESCSNIYHCVSRCVRQASLLAARPDGLGGSRGEDDHRRRWTVDRIRHLAEIFAIDCIAFAIMSNHLHLLLRTMPELVEHWSDDEVAYRWLLLHPPRLQRMRTGLDPDASPQAEEIARLAADAAGTAKRRKRLSSLSWYMKELKEWLARRANREEQRTGAFWEERFRSFRVLDDAGLLLCATYIDLNPVAAGIVDDPIRATFTSVAEHSRRCGALLQAASGGAAATPDCRDVGGDSDSEGHATLDAFMASLDERLFTSAVPARRQPHVPTDAPDAATERGEVGAETEATQQMRHRVESVASGVEHDSGEQDLAAAVVAPHRRKPPAEALLGMRLGDYFRRLRLLGGLARVRLASTREGSGTHRLPPEVELELAREVDATALSRLATALCGGNPAEAMDMLAQLLAATRLFGSAVGTPASLGIEALRRGTKRVVMAIRSRAPRRLDANPPPEVAVDAA